MARKSKRRPPGDPTRAVGYVRVSTDKQALGLEAQRGALAQWCERNGVELVDVHDDIGISGGAELDDRPGLLSALDALRVHGAGVLLVAKRDRLARKPLVASVAERIAQDNGARIVSTAGEGTDSDDPADCFLRTILDGQAAYDRAVIRARIKAALAVKRARGERVGQIPLGRCVAVDGKRLEVNPGEAATIERACLLRADGLSIRAIAERLNADSTPARGYRWHPTTIARILRENRIGPYHIEGAS